MGWGVEDAPRFMNKKYVLDVCRSGGATRTLPKLLLIFSQQIAIGMKYLSQKGFVHGNVKASSIMLSAANVCKVWYTYTISPQCNKTSSGSDVINGFIAR